MPHAARLGAAGKKWGNVTAFAVWLVFSEHGRKFTTSMDAGESSSLELLRQMALMLLFLCSISCNQYFQGFQQ